MRTDMRFPEAGNRTRGPMCGIRGPIGQHGRMYGAGSIGTPPTRTSKCRCGPVE
jgi:hypothetical protein